MSFPMFNFGPNPDDIHYLHLDTIVQGKGSDRLKYLDLEGRWVLNGRSIPYISAAFNHIENLNYAKGAIFDIVDPAINAIGGVTWTPEQQEVKEVVVERKKKPFTVPIPPVVEIDGEIPPSPREVVPHRSAGYGPAHQKRKLSVPDRSRSNSISSRGPSPDFIKHTIKNGSKDNITSYGTKWGSPGRDDAGYGSAASSGAPSPNLSYLAKENGSLNDRYPHRTQAISPLPERRPAYDSNYDSSYLKKATETYQSATVEIKGSSDQSKQYGRSNY